MPRPRGIIARVSRPDMPVCGQFHVRRALEIRDNFMGAAMRTPLPRWVRFGLGPAQPARKLYPRKRPRPPAAVAVAVGTEIALRPPHRSRRALLTHRAPPSGQTSAARGTNHLPSGAQPPIGSTWLLGSVPEPRPLHARRAAFAFPSRPDTSPGAGETSQVPRRTSPRAQGP
jgi:hypothetical protein